MARTSRDQLQILDCVFFSISRRSVEFADGSVRARLHALIAADAVGRIPDDGVLVDTQDVYLAQDALRAGFHTLPAGLADMGIDKDMLRLVL